MMIALRKIFKSLSKNHLIDIRDNDHDINHTQFVFRQYTTNQQFLSIITAADLDLA